MNSTVNAYQRTEALRAALELDLFSQVAAGHQTAAQLAGACRGVRILADYLTVLGFLHKHEDRYELTPEAKAFLDRRSPAYLCGALDFLLAPRLRESFQQLTAAVRQGERPRPTRAPSRRTTRSGWPSPGRWRRSCECRPRRACHFGT